jgi:hypothetical protein
MTERTSNETRSTTYIEERNICTRNGGASAHAHAPWQRRIRHLLHHLSPAFSHPTHAHFSLLSPTSLLSCTFFPFLNGTGCTGTNQLTPYVSLTSLGRGSSSVARYEGESNEQL